MALSADSSLPGSGSSVLHLKRAGFRVWGLGFREVGQTLNIARPSLASQVAGKAVGPNHNLRFWGFDAIRFNFATFTQGLQGAPVPYKFLTMCHVHHRPSNSLCNWSPRARYLSKEKNPFLSLSFKVLCR